MTTDEKYIKAITILKEIYPEPNYVITITPSVHYYYILDKTIYNIIGRGYYSLSGIDFIYYNNEIFKYLINKLTELNVGVFDIDNDDGPGGVILYFYDKLKNIKI